MTIQIALIGDYNPAVIAHQAIPLALQLAAQAIGQSIESVWVATDSITRHDQLTAFDGIWCVPASPYRSMGGALLAIRYARENRRPFLGSCGGFQHVIIEYARNQLGWRDAEHAETTPQASRLVIAPLACALVEEIDAVYLQAGSRLARAYGCATVNEGYHCRYGLNPQHQAALLAGLLRATARDRVGDVRAVELDQHPFFVATLFQSERAALAGRLPPLVDAFAQACLAQQRLASQA